MIRNCMIQATLLVAMAVASFSVNALIIEYSTTSLGSDSFRYDYTLTNDNPAGSANVGLFSILFDTSLYDFTSLAIVSNPSTSEWEQIILAPAIGVPAAFDLFASGSGIAPGSMMSGFAIEFDWLGGLEGPGSQAFEVFDPLTFALLDEGVTTASSVPVAEANSISLLLLGLVGLVFFRLWWGASANR